MVRSAREKLTYANVMSTLAVFAVLGGTAWALADDSVKSRHIVDDQVKDQDVKDDDLTGADIDESSLDEVPDATEVNRVTAEAFRYVRDIDPTPEDETVFQLDDFEMKARCGETGPGGPASLTTDVFSHKNNASLSAQAGDGTTDIENDFDNGELEVLSGDAYNDGMGPNTLVYVSPNTGIGPGQDGGDVVTVQWMADEEDGLAGRDCVLSGIAFQRDFAGAIVP